MTYYKFITKHEYGTCKADCPIVGKKCKTGDTSEWFYFHIMHIYQLFYLSPVTVLGYCLF